MLRILNPCWYSHVEKNVLTSRHILSYQCQIQLFGKAWAISMTGLSKDASGNGVSKPAWAQLPAPCQNPVSTSNTSTITAVVGGMMLSEHWVLDHPRKRILAELHCLPFQQKILTFDVEMETVFQQDPSAASCLIIPARKTWAIPIRSLTSTSICHIWTSKSNYCLISQFLPPKEARAFVFHLSQSGFFLDLLNL